MAKVYLPRKLEGADKTFLEAEVLEHHRIVIVLAEPGAGKSELLKSFGLQCNVKPMKAAKFLHQTKPYTESVLILDALDEVAQTNPTDLDAIFTKAEETEAEKLIFASRSAEWNAGRCDQIETFLGTAPSIFYLTPLTRNEAQQICENHAPHINFDKFADAVEKNDLGELLKNPQLVEILADAYTQSGHDFESKRQIFENATLQMVHFKSQSARLICKIPDRELCQCSGQIFAEILLSGSIGISVDSDPHDILYPPLNLLISEEAYSQNVLNTRLFKPSGEVGQHEPIHRIVAEYLAAAFLGKHLASPHGSLSSRGLFAVLAPNGVVREDLRGLLGWLGSLGSQDIQDKAIQLDPYTVLTSGDPNALTDKSKANLISQLWEKSKNDPYFRGGDHWRSFNTTSLFTEEVIQITREILQKSDPKGQLVSLILEMLEKSPVVSQLEQELLSIILNSKVSHTRRELALECLINCGCKLQQIDYQSLLESGSANDLVIATAYRANPRVACNDLNDIVELLQATSKNFSLDDWEARYYVRRNINKFLERLQLTEVEYLLDNFTKNIRCTCGSDYCECRYAPSKIAGILLDHYFERVRDKLNAGQIWSWTKNLRYRNGRSDKDSKAIEVLRSKPELRHDIHELVLSDVHDYDELKELWHPWMTGHMHSGLYVPSEDLKQIVNDAFQKKNIAIWRYFITRHNYYSPERGPNVLRRYMRAQANADPIFMRLWQKDNRRTKALFEEWRDRPLRATRRFARREKQNAAANSLSLKRDRDAIRDGKFWWWTNHFGDLYLNHPEKISDEIGDLSLVVETLKNSLPALEKHGPSLSDWVDGKANHRVIRAMTAACLVMFRECKDLSNVSVNVLSLVKAEFHSYQGIPNDEEKDFVAEINKNLFPDKASKESFLRRCIEPILQRGGKGRHNHQWLTYDEIFNEFKTLLPIEWLERYPRLPANFLNDLFEMSLQAGQKKRLREIILKRCDTICSEKELFGPCCSDEAERRSFWLFRYFVFEDDMPECHWQTLVKPHNSVFIFAERYERLSHMRSKAWPHLTLSKILRILEEFLPRWPKVPLPSSFGSDSPDGERAYRFLRELIWNATDDVPETSIPLLEGMLQKPIYIDFQNDVKHLLAKATEKTALQHVTPPSPEGVCKLLFQGIPNTVEGMRVLIVEKLEALQAKIIGGEFDTVNKFYNGDKRLGETDATKRIAEDLDLMLQPLGMPITIEHHLRDNKRCDITVSNILNEKRRLLVIEVKGQWHDELFTAAEEQLYDKYAIHQDAENQGIYLVLWYGEEEKIAGRTTSPIKTPEQLKHKIEGFLPKELIGRVDVIVLDLSRRLERTDTSIEILQ
ncbi:NACHT domain-containing protein [Pseudovibrio ascidiaceicola]|uniref:NACHT domain-containing protein n=1 Tax=Pseudovibrio ascidiaceicola TaxID=285279 RepID=UPI003D366F0B